MKIFVKALAIVLFLLAGCSSKESSQPVAHLNSTISYVPIAMGPDLTTGWGAGLRREADQLKIKYELHDPNWSTDAGAQALTNLIDEKPEFIVVQNPDVQAYSRVLKRAQDSGIHVIQVGMVSTFHTEGFVGANYSDLGSQLADEAVRRCGKGSGRSGQVAIVQGVNTAEASVRNMEGIKKVFDQHPEIKVVSNQAADWDASKAQNITSTVLQQYPNLCAVIGFWDGMDTGSAAAIHQAGKTNQVFLLSQGAGEKAACDAVASGAFTFYLNYDVRRQNRDLDEILSTLASKGGPPSNQEIVRYTPLTPLTKTTLKPDSCWDIKTYAGEPASTTGGD